MMSSRKTKPVAAVPAAAVPAAAAPAAASTVAARGLPLAPLVAIGLVLAISLTAFAVWKFKSPTTAASATRPATRPVFDSSVYTAYAGSVSCRECHAKEYEAWAKSHHGLAERLPDAALDRAAFEPARTFPHGSQTTKVWADGGKYQIETIGSEGKVARHPVERVIGHAPLRQFLTPGAGGRLQALEASYDPHKNDWFNVYGAEDRRFGEWGHWTGRGMNWNSMCAACHNTRLRKNYDEALDTYHTTMSELTVSCESCHGPMKAHVTAYKQGAGVAAAPPASRPSLKLAKVQMLDTCGTCHSRRAELTGDFVPRDNFHDHHSLTIPDLSDLFYPDGQVREEDYEFTAFLGSKMHAAGVSCLDCHEPHSAKTLMGGNNLCMRCHNGSFQGSPVIVPEIHSKHLPKSAGNQCVSCHMPVTTYMQRHGRHDHRFTIPDPLLTKQFGVPNACNRCHTGKDADWSLAAVEKWYGPKMNRPSRARAQAIARARAGDDGAREPLLRMLTEEKQSFWRAVAAGVLGPWVGSPDVLAALVAQTSHADPLVRENAARSLEPAAQQNEPTSRAALARLLEDPVRSVRTRAAWALRNSVDENSRAGKDLLAYMAHNADQPGGAMQQGAYHLARGDVAGAAAYFRKAITWDPNSAAFRDSLAVVLSMQGQTDQAIEQLGHAAALDPREAEFPYKLALAHAEKGETEKAVGYLQQALKLNPRHPRAGYNLGLIYNSTGRVELAVATLQEAERASPGDAQIPYALATIYLQRREIPQAREAAMRAVRANPQYREAVELLRRLGQ